MKSPSAVLLGLALLCSASFAADGTLQIQIFDKATRKPLHARVSLLTSDKVARWGKDVSGVDLAYGGLPRFWTAGELKQTLPEGEVEVVVSRPFDFLPFKTKLLIRAGETTRVEAALERLVDIHGKGWFGGDVHVHVVHGEMQFNVDMARVIPIARAEGEDWVSFAQAWSTWHAPQMTPQQLDTLSRKSSDADFLCTWGMEHPKDHLGHMAAFPLGVPKTYQEAVGGNDYQAFSGKAGKHEGFTHFEILRAMKNLGTLAVYSHPTREYGGTKESVGNIARELPFDVVGAPWSLEALDIFCDAPGHAADEKLAYYLFNRGLRFAICGFTDVCYDRKGERPGDTRTFVYLGKREQPEIPLSMPKIIEAVRKRKTFATTGPLVLFTAGEHGIGDVIPAGVQVLKARIEAWNGVDYADPRKDVGVSKVDVLRNGAVWKSFAAPAAAKYHTVEFDIKEEGTAWYAVKVYGTDPKTQFAVTSPIFFEGADYKAPAVPVSTVRGTVKDEKSGAKLNGIVRVIEYSAQGRTERSKSAFKDGAFAVQCPADCRIEISAEGYMSQLKSLFLDVEKIYADMFLKIHRPALTDDAFYTKLQEALKEIEFNIRLVP